MVAIGYVIKTNVNPVLRTCLENEHIFKGYSEHNHTISRLKTKRLVYINKMKILALLFQNNSHQVVSESSILCSLTE